MDFYSGKIALVTGGASGIGRALAQALAARGATVVVADLNAPAAQEVTAALVKAGQKAEAAALDVTDAAAFEAVVSQAWARHGRLDLFFNNAGIGGAYAEVQELTLAQWRRVLDVNLFGVIHGITAVYPRMVKQGFGHIINTASAAGLIPCPMMGPYTTAKHGVVGLSKGLRAEAKALGVRVSAVCPGFIETAIFEKSTEYSGIKREEVEKLMPATLSAAECAKVILAGVRSNRAIITVTALAAIAWWLWRWLPGRRPREIATAPAA